MPGECQWLYGATICDLYDHFFVELHIDSNRIDWIELVWRKLYGNFLDMSVCVPFSSVYPQ